MQRNIKSPSTHKMSKQESATSKTIDKSIAMLAHDLKAPIQALDALLKTSQNLAKSSFEYRTLETVVNRLSTMVGDLSFSSAARLRTSGPETFNLKDLLMRVNRDCLIEKGREADIRVVIEGEPELYNCTLYRGPLERALCNLVNNAIEAIEGKTGLLRWHVSIGNNQSLCITLSDTGRGMDAEALSRLGEWGYTYGKVLGEGKGFCGAQKSLAEQEVTTAVFSIPGRGTRVRLTLPNHKWHLTSGCVFGNLTFGI